MASSSPQILNRKSTELASSPFASASTQQSFSSDLYDTKILHLADICYPESYLRTPLPLLPFPNLRWLAEEAYNEAESSATEEENPDTVRESIETSDEMSSATEIWGDGKREWNGWQEPHTLKRRLNDDENYNSHPSTPSTTNNKKQKKPAPTS
jgi:hypothetical protein